MGNGGVNCYVPVLANVWTSHLLMWGHCSGNFTIQFESAWRQQFHRLRQFKWISKCFKATRETIDVWRKRKGCVSSDTAACQHFYLITVLPMCSFLIWESAQLVLYVFREDCWVNNYQSAILSSPGPQAVVVVLIPFWQDHSGALHWCIVWIKRVWRKLPICQLPLYWS